jgi:hypothetical protein
MDPIARNVGRRAGWLALWSVCSLVVASPVAHAAVFSVPLRDLGTIVRLNAVKQRNINLIHLSQTSIGQWNSQVATISVWQRNRYGSQPATMVTLPTSSLTKIKQLNANANFVEQTAVGARNTQVVDVDVYQSNSSYGSRLLAVPVSSLGQVRSLNQKNFNVVHVYQTAAGYSNTQVALIDVDQRNAAKLKVPTRSLNDIKQLNSNVAVVNQTAAGSHNTQVAEITVNQSNR